jgi:tetraacyldisaccharide 4'-kinase
MDYSAGEMVDIQSSQRRLINTLKGDKVLLVSGIGGPKIFQKMIQMDLSVDIKGHLKFGDHHNYSDADIQRIDAEFEKLGCDLVLTTAKDGVKLKGRLKSPTFYVELQKDLKNLEEQLSRVVFG